jgi:drug/metabolite transporter (DMT)-like permease
MLAAFCCTLLFACSAITGRRLSHLVPGTQANLTRLLIAATLLGLWSHFFGSGLHGPAFPFLFASGCVGFGVGDLALFQTYPRLGTRRAMVMVQCLAAPFAALAEWVWLNHSPTLPQAGFGLLVLTGVGLALMPAKNEPQPGTGLAAGFFFGTISALCQGGGAVLSRKGYAVAAAAGAPLHGLRDGINAAYQRMVGGILISAAFFLYLKLAHRPQTASKSNWAAGWPWAAANGMLGPAFGVTCFQWALMSSPTNLVLPIVATTPLVVLPLAHFIEGDRITRRAILGGLIAVGGVIGLTLSK